MRSPGKGKSYWTTGRSGSAVVRGQNSEQRGSDSSLAIDHVTSEGDHLAVGVFLDLVLPSVEVVLLK